MYADVDKRLWRAAANSVFSHLLALQRERRVDPSITDGEGTGTLGATWSLI
jgi:hypothetical protein